MWWEQWRVVGLACKPKSSKPNWKTQVETEYKMPKISHWMLVLALVTVLDSSLNFGAERMHADWLWVSAVFLGVYCWVAIQCASGK